MDFYTIVPWYTLFFTFECRVALHAWTLLVATIKNQKKLQLIQTIKCHSLLAALHFPLKTTSFERFRVHWGCRPKRKFTSWVYQINFIHTWCYIMNSVNFAKQNKIVKYNKTETDGLLKIRELCGGQRSISLTFYDNSLLLFNLRNLSILGSFTLT